MTRRRNGAKRRVRHIWTTVEVTLLERNYADSRIEDLAIALGQPIERVRAKANSLGLKKSRDLVAQIARERMEHNQGARRSQFQKGIVPANKGKKMPAGWAPGRMASTQFRKGERPHTWLPVGSFSVNSDGYLDQKVNDDPGPRHVRWKPVHRLVWEAANGPVPAGHTVVFKPGKSTNVLDQITLDAVELITRAELMRRNTIHNLPPPLKAVTVLRGRLTRQINKRAKESGNDE